MEPKEIETPIVDNSQEGQDEEVETTEEVNDDPKEKRHSEQMKGAKQEVDRWKNIVLEEAVQKVVQDGNALLEYHKKDPKFANELATKFVDDDGNKFTSYEAAKKFIEGRMKKSDQPSGLAEDDFNTKFEKEYQARRQKEEHDKSIAKVERLFSKLPEDIQEKAQTYFNKITKGQMLEEDDALEFAEMATLYVSKDKLKEGKFQEVMASAASTGLSKAKSGPKSTGPKYDLDDHGNLIEVS